MKLLLVVVSVLAALLLTAGLFVYFAFFHGEPTFLGLADHLRPAAEEAARRHAISPQRALELAQPRLEESFALRRAMHGWVPPERNPHPNWMKDPGRVYLALDGEHYLVVKDSYPYKVLNGWMCRAHAVRVHATTGQVLPPE